MEGSQKEDTLRTYGERETFEGRLEEGFIEVSFGVGEWNGFQRIAGLCALYHPDGKIVTYEHLEIRPDVTSTPIQHFKREYTTENFEGYIITHRVNLSHKISLADLVNNWKSN